MSNTDDMVPVPRWLLQAASDSLGSFVSDHGWSQQDMDNMDSLDAYLAQPAASGEPPDMRHPKIQALIGAKARREIELQLVEQLLDEGPDCDLTSLDMEYWHGLHDKLRDKLMATAQPAPAPAARREPVAWIEGPHGVIRKNLFWRLDPMPPQSVAWSIPLYTAQPAPARVPGWVLVPVELTAEMFQAFHEITDEAAMQHGQAGACWCAMLAAAPTAQKGAQP